LYLGTSIRQRTSEQWAAELGALNAGIIALADQEFVFSVNCGNQVFGSAEQMDTLMRDGLHPNAEGAVKYAQCLRPSIEKIMALPQLVA
jgi:lysophospholipase L1-like esterase